MLVFSHKMVFIKNEPALLCVTIQEYARAFAATIAFSVQCFDKALSLKILVFVVTF